MVDAACVDARKGEAAAEPESNTGADEEEGDEDAEEASADAAAAATAAATTADPSGEPLGAAAADPPEAAAPQAAEAFERVDGIAPTRGVSLPHPRGGGGMPQRNTGSRCTEVCVNQPRDKRAKARARATPDRKSVV